MSRAFLTLGALLLAPPAFGAPCADPGACLSEAQALLGTNEGNPSPAQRAAALPLTEAACGGGLGWGCFLAGVLLTDGIGVPVDPERALGRHEQACALDIAESCGQVGFDRATHNPTPARATQAITSYRRACTLAVAQIRQRPHGDPIPPELCSDFAQATRLLDGAWVEHVALARTLRAEATTGRLRSDLRTGVSNARMVLSELLMNANRTLCGTTSSVETELRHAACMDLAAAIRRDNEEAERRWPTLSVEVATGIEADLCREGHRPGCVAWGRTQQAATTATPNDTSGLAVLHDACASGDIKGCRSILEWYQRCTPGPTEPAELDCAPERGVLRARALCAAPNQAACELESALTALLEDRRNLPTLQRACTRGDAAACGKVAQTMPFGADRLAVLDEACTAGNLTGCWMQAVAVLYGEGVPIDRDRARALTAHMCQREEPHPNACGSFCSRFPDACPR